MEYNLEFDGTTVLCCVCGDKSSGFHYGVHSCEGCKGFFRRSIQQKIQYRPCTKNQQCSILRISRNRCQYCRLKKCISVGMSRDAVRFGRVPKREKAKILAAMQKNNQSSQEKMLTEQLMDEQAMLKAIFDAHNETCDFTHSKMAPVFLKAEQNPTFADYPSQMTCPLNPLSAPASPDSTQISDSFSPAIKGVVQFARRLPGFSSLLNEDQVTLLKAGVFEALLVRLAVLFRTSEKMYCLNGQILRRSDAVDSSQNGRFLFECMFELGERVNALRLTDEDIALFSAVVLVTPDRPGLRNVELVQKIHHKLDQLLMNQMASNHPEEPNLYTELKKKIPDLRTLNTLHSEKLLAVKMDSNHNADGVVSTSSGASSSSSTPNYPYADYSSNSFKCNQSVASDWSDFGSPRSVGSSCDNESTSIKALDMCPYSPSEQMAQFHLSNLNSHAVPGHNVASSSTNHQLNSNLVVSNNNSVNSPSSLSYSSAGQNSSNRASSSLSNFSSSSNYSYNGALALHSSNVTSVCSSVASSTNNNNNITSTVNNERSSSVINKPRFGQLNCYLTNTTSNHLISNNINSQQKTNEDKLIGRVDSPSDSGIESGKEGNSATSVCSSPRSDSEDHNNNQTSQKNKSTNNNISTISTTNSSVITNNHSNNSIDQMPLLKRALQAPPLLNTTSLLMDEAYRHHKKFRATKMQQAQRELEAQSPQSSVQSNLSTHDELVQQQHQNNNSLASTHLTLVKTLQQPTRFANEQQLKRTDLIHTIIMRNGGDSNEISNSKLFGRLSDNNNLAHSSDSIHSTTNQSRSSIIHTVSSSQSTLQQLLAPKPNSSSFNTSSFGNSAPSPLKFGNLTTQHHISGISPPSPASSLVNNSPPPHSSLLNHHNQHPSIFQYSPSTQHLFSSNNLDAHHSIHPAHHHNSTALLMEAQPLDLSNSKKSSPITPPISPKVETN